MTLTRARAATTAAKVMTTRLKAMTIVHAKHRAAHSRANAFAAEGRSCWWVWPLQPLLGVDRAAAADELDGGAKFMRPEELVQRHICFNEATADGWERFAPHRARLTERVAALGRGGRLGVLGAGNGNDLDLESLAQAWDEIVLIDLDAAALGRLVHRTKPHLRRKLRVMAPIDVSGALDVLAHWGKLGVPRSHELSELPELACGRVLESIGPSFDAVVSCCVLSQILVSCADALGPRHPQLRLVGAGLVVAHLSALVRLVAPGGCALVATDAVTSRWFPFHGQGNATAIMAAARDAGKLIPGTDPAFLKELLESDDAIAPFIASAAFFAPWIWHVAKGLTAVAYTLQLCRNDRTPPAGPANRKAL